MEFREALENLLKGNAIKSKETGDTFKNLSELDKVVSSEIEGEWELGHVWFRVTFPEAIKYLIGGYTIRSIYNDGTTHDIYRNREELRRLEILEVDFKWEVMK